ncbi:hypothetical protein Trydic_g17680 [Trypoxylus dichotomus]
MTFFQSGFVSSSTIQETIPDNPQELFRFIRTKQGSTRIPGSFRVGDENINDPDRIVNAFAARFLSTQILSCSPLSYSGDSNNPALSVLAATDDALIKIMAKFPDRRTAGDDGIPSFLIRDTWF